MDSGRAAAGGVLAAACISTFVVNANTSAVTILLPTMSEDTGAPVAQLQWAVTGYMLVGAAVIVTSGALGDVFGRRRVFLGGLALVDLADAGGTIAPEPRTRKEARGLLFGFAEYHLERRMKSVPMLVRTAT